MLSLKSSTLMSAISLAVVFAAHGQTALELGAKPSPAKLSPLVVEDYALNEDRPDGVNAEPAWVRNRRFSTTRIYIQQDPGEVGVEQWYRLRTYDGGRVTQRSQSEVEVGLPNRMQLDIYENAILDNQTGNGWEQEEVAFELRYAFADWGVIPLNPTLYFEYAFCHQGADGIEPKLLIGDDFGKGWHWGVNFIHERRVWGDAEAEWRLATGISKSIVDSCFSIGVEGQYAYAVGGKSSAILGPTVQWRPTDNTHLDLVAMAGLNESSPNAECWLIFGCDFGKGEHEVHGYKPTSVGGN
jgi:hypothetical protein